MSKMASLLSLYVVFYLAAVFSSVVQGEPEIVAPFPKNIIPFEYEKAEVTCVFTDTTGAKPDDIEFVRKSDFGDKTKIPDEGKSGRIYYENRTEDGGKKLFKTIHFNKVVANDDSIFGQYECEGVSSGKTYSFGFAISVVKVSEMPTAKVEGATVSVGGSANLTCDVKNPTFLNKMKQLSWVKDSKVVAMKLNSHTIEPITINKASVKDAGEYLCIGLVNFRLSLLRNITFGAATLKIKLRMATGVTKLEAKVSGNVTMECPADGYPMNVSWWRVNGDGEAVKLKMSQRYMATRACSFCRYALTITSLEARDSGGYACHVNSTIGSGRHLFQLAISDESTTVLPTSAPDGNTTVVPTSVDGEKPNPGANAMKYSAQSTLLFIGYLVTWLLL